MNPQTRHEGLRLERLKGLETAGPCTMPDRFPSQGRYRSGVGRCTYAAIGKAFVYKHSSENVTP